MKKKRKVPHNSKDKRRVYVNKQGGDLIDGMEDERVPPRNNGACKGAYETC